MTKKPDSDKQLKNAKWYCDGCGEHELVDFVNGDIVCRRCRLVIASYRLESDW